MIKIDYTFTTKTPLHTGSDKDYGTAKTLRRQKIILREPVKVKSAFANEDERNDAIVNILAAVHRSIDFDGIKGRRLMGIWDEWFSKLLKASTTNTKAGFIGCLCEGWGVRAIKDDEVLEIIDHISAEELIETARTNAHYLTLKLRTKTKEKGQPTIFSSSSTKSGEFVKTYEMLPMVSGNSIRGIMRRLVMHDYIVRAGIQKLSKSNYHMLFTGGILNDSTMYEDLDKRKQLIDLCPMLGVFGAAIGNMTIEGSMSVGMAYPICRELGTGEKSYWEYLDMIFQTRLDSSKTEKDIEIEGDEKRTAPDQMKYEYEVFAPGTPFSHAFRMLEMDPVWVSAFWHALTLLKENPFIGGMWAIGNAECDLSGLVIPDGANQVYLGYIDNAKEAANAFFSVLPRA
jgi:hypothetical protein